MLKALLNYQTSPDFEYMLGFNLCAIININKRIIQWKNYNTEFSTFLKRARVLLHITCSALDCPQHVQRYTHAHPLSHAHSHLKFWPGFGPSLYEFVDYADISFYLLIGLFLTVLGLCCCSQALSSSGEQGLLSSCGAQASHAGGFSCCGAHALGHRLSCPEVCGLLPDQGSNPCPLHWHVDSLCN